jgi:molecular chaperone DnaK (HSP70)
MHGSRRIDRRRQVARLRVAKLARDGNGGDLRDGELILICDIGGGTTDFSLVRARLVNGELQFERTAIGEHLLLGGDNLDFALARRVKRQARREAQRYQAHAATALCITPGLLCRERAAAQ